MKLSLLEKFANSARIRIQFQLSPHRLALLICNHRIGLSQIYRDLFRYILHILDELSLPGLDQIVATGSRSEERRVGRECRYRGRWYRNNNEYASAESQNILM